MKVFSLKSEADPAARRRWTIYGLLIAIAVGQMAGRLMAVNSVDYVRLEKHRIDVRLGDLREELAAGDADPEAIEERIAERRAELEAKLRLQRPFLSSNDRSRWMTIRALVEHGTFAIDKVLEEPTWDSIDIVQHTARDGEKHIYSSKPPLLVTLLAGEYWLIHKLTGATLGTHPYTIGRAMLVTTNLIPLALMLVLVAAVVDRFCDRLPGSLSESDWPRLFIVASGCFGTLLTPFAVVLNNHLVAAVSASVALYAWARIRIDGDQRPQWFALAGLASAFTAANELPALAFLVFLGLALLVRHPVETLKGFTPAVLLIATAFFTTNYAAHETFKPAYAFRSEDDPEQNWYDFTYTVRGRERTSYWSSPEGIDRGEPDPGVYAFHSLVGHHGVFSLTPMWLLSFGGMAWFMVKGKGPEREFALGVLALSVICMAFYLSRDQLDRNYGGMTCGFRWMIWFTPLWLAGMAPAAAWMARSLVGRVIALACLAVSAFSAAFPTWNPWTQPWAYQWLESMGWQGFY